jgi:hypothetical protein
MALPQAGEMKGLVAESLLLGELVERNFFRVFGKLMLVPTFRQLTLVCSTLNLHESTNMNIIHAANHHTLSSNMEDIYAHSFGYCI